jgi:hypothetical protein
MAKSTGKKFKLSAEEIKLLVTGHGACLATDRITVSGEPVDYMYREQYQGYFRGKGVLDFNGRT